MYDGTVLAAHPERKPGPRIMKRDRLRIDPDGVVKEFSGTYVKPFRNTEDNGRFRFLDIMANRLNTRRAIRELVVSKLDDLMKQTSELRSQLERIEQGVSAILEKNSRRGS